MWDAQKWRKNTEGKNPSIIKANQKSIMLLTKCACCRSKKSTFIKKQKASGLVRNLGLKTPSSKIQVLDVILF